MPYDYGTPEANLKERARVMEEGRTAARMGESSFGAGGYKPGDMHRASDWLRGYHQIIPKCANKGCTFCRARII